MGKRKNRQSDNTYKYVRFILHTMLSTEIVDKIKKQRKGTKISKTLSISAIGLKRAETMMQKLSLDAEHKIKISFFVDFLIDLFYESNKKTIFNMKGERE